MKNIIVLGVQTNSYGTKFIDFSYEDKLFPGKQHEWKCKLSPDGDITYEDSGKVYTMSDEESAPIKAVLLNQ